MNAAQLINQDSGDTEYYTDPRIIDAAWEVMGEIDLDPASSHTANRIVNATTIFTADDDGLAHEWFGNVWMNHPFSKGEDPCKPKCTKKICVERGFHISERIPGNADWINKLVFEYQSGRIMQSCNITFAATSEGWFQPLIRNLQCFLSPRTNYYLPDGSLKRGVTKGSVVTYIGPNGDRFRKVFSKFGVVK